VFDCRPSRVTGV